MRTLDGPVRWGIIGVGNVTEKKSGPGLAKAEGSALVAVMRRDADAAADYSRRHGVPRHYADADALVQDDGVDAVYVATPPDSHAEYAIRVARAGKPVYVEKPMARTAAECDAMIAACQEAGVPLFVAYYRRAMPRFELVHQLLDEGAIGTVLTVNVHLLGVDRTDRDHLPWRVIPSIAGGGFFVDLAAHALDVFDHWFGAISEVAGQAANRGGSYPAEDTVTMSWRHANGVQGTGTWCFCTSRSTDEILIEGTLGTLATSCFGEEPVRLVTGSGERSIEAPYPRHVQQPLIQTIVDELHGRGRCPSTGETARRTSAVIDSVLAGYRSGLTLPTEEG
jgi:predicted dehydrogenase